MVRRIRCFKLKEGESRPEEEPYVDRYRLINWIEMINRRMRMFGERVFIERIEDMDHYSSFHDFEREQLAAANRSFELSRCAHISEETILELTQTGHFPCVWFDKERPRYFKKSAIEYIKKHLLRYQEGKAFSLEVVQIADEITPCIENLPDVLKRVKGLKKHTRTIYEPCVYFLADAGEVVYVGQSIDLPSRLRAHLSRSAAENGIKTFDEVFYLNVQKKELIDVESRFIRALNPKYNLSHGLKYKKDDPYAEKMEGGK